MSELNTALIVMMVGMVTVFTILGLVVSSGHFLIYVVNTFFPAAVAKKTKPRISQSITPPPSSTPQGPAVAAIVAAVDILTEGKGKVQRIEKQN